MPLNQAGVASGVTLAIVVGVAGLGVAISAALIETLTGGGTTQGEAIEEVLRWVAIGSAARRWRWSRCGARASGAAT